MIDWVVLTADASVIVYALARWLDYGRSPDIETEPVSLSSPIDSRNVGSTSAANLVYAVGAFIMAIHIVCSYGIAHEWSHQAALDHTANETLDVVGVAVPHGVYVNFLFLIVYVANGVWRFRLGASRMRRPQVVAIAIDCFLDAIVLMATVVFETGWIRWVMIGFVLAIVLRWCSGIRQNS